jgi:hypothetical protein
MFQDREPPNQFGSTLTIILKCFFVSAAAPIEAVDVLPWLKFMLAIHFRDYRALLQEFIDMIFGIINLPLQQN